VYQESNWFFDVIEWYTSKLVHLDTDLPMIERFTDVDTSSRVYIDDIIQVDGPKASSELLLLCNHDCGISAFDDMFGEALTPEHTLRHLTKTLIQVIRFLPQWTSGHRWPTDPELLKICQSVVTSVPQRNIQSSNDLENHDEYLGTKVCEQNDPNHCSFVQRGKFESKGLRKITSVYTAEEITTAENFIFRHTQKHYAPNLYNALSASDYSLLGAKAMQLVHYLDMSINNDGIITTRDRDSEISSDVQTHPKRLIWIPSIGRVAFAIQNDSKRYPCQRGYCFTP
jgi:hypothetical protein